jgi:S1-C subfamily serine protease
VAEGGPAGEAGLRPGDIITSLDGEEVASPEDLLAVLRRLDPGDTIDIEFNRGSDGEQARIELTERPTEGL